MRWTWVRRLVGSIAVALATALLLAGGAWRPAPAAAEPGDSPPAPVARGLPEAQQVPQVTPTRALTALPNTDCLTCHSNTTLHLILRSGERLDLNIDIGVFSQSVHAAKVGCADCHPRNAQYPHDPVQAGDLREYRIANYQTCGRCHFLNFTKSLDSVHYEVLSSGDRRAPLCVDCHGAHDVQRPDQPRSRISRNCGSCHRDIFDQYSQSVHGAALLEESNPDVPTCTNCHGVHDIHDPRTASFRQQSVDLCIRCHSDKTLMDRYGISTAVAKTYLEDFHGKTLSFKKSQSANIWVKEAVCTDCHGVHNIVRANAANSPVLKANLVQTCRKCHADAQDNFPDAWMSHYEPSMKKTPLVWGVRWFYRILIPSLVGGLVLQIGLDAWRFARNR